MAEMNGSVSPGEGELNMVETKGKAAIKGIQEQRVRENNLEVNVKYKDTVLECFSLTGRICCLCIMH